MAPNEERPTWAIAWKHRKDDDDHGRGDPVHLTEEECQEACNKYNRIAPRYIHWPVEVKDE